MIIEIGITAGEIWRYLEDHGQARLSQLFREIDKPQDVVVMSLGWLAREGYVILEGEKDYLVSLRK